MKKILSLLLCALLLTALVSCGTEGDAPDTTAADTTVADTTAADTTAADTTAADTTAADTTAPDTTEEEEYIPGDIEWSFDETDGTLTVSGTGAMANYLAENDSKTDAPWNEHQKEITNVVIEEGVTAIGDNAFAYLHGLAGIHIPASVKKVGKNAFNFDYSLTDVYYAGSEENWQGINIGSGNSLLKEAARHCGE